MSKTACVIAFALGAAVGAVVSWKLLETKYEQITREEIEDVKRVYAANSEDDNEEDQDVEDSAEVEYTPSENDTKRVAEVVNKLRYSTYADAINEPVVVAGRKPYVISPEEFGEIDEFEQISLTYYADGILADDHDEKIDDVDDVVGLDSLNHFGEYEDDSVFVRNEPRKADFEILLDHRRYSDVIN